jgi:hypothetical protein
MILKPAYLLPKNVRKASKEEAIQAIESPIERLG